MRAGTLRHRVAIENQADTAGAATGEVNPAWSAFHDGWRCSITPLRGQELANAQQRYGTVTHRLQGRYVAGITPQQRIRLGTRVFRLEAVIDVDERNRELDILATEVIPGA